MTHRIDMPTHPQTTQAGAVMTAEDDRILRLLRRYRWHCHEQARGWFGRPDDDGRSDLWIGRAEGISSFLNWTKENEERP